MTLEELEEKMPKRVDVKGAAEIMGLTPTLLREFLMEDKFSFGTAIQLRQTESYINTKRFIKYMKGK